MGKVLIFGSINTDLVTYVKTLPAPGETVIGNEFLSFPGGKGANQAVAAAYDGAQVELFGCVGDDSFGKERIRNLENAGIVSQSITVKSDTHTGVAQIIIDKRGENLIAVAPGANSKFSRGDVSFSEYPSGERIVSLFQNEIPQATTEGIIQECHKKKMIVLWNTAPACQQKPSKETSVAVDYLICNQPELAVLTGTEDNESSAQVLQSWGINNIIVTLGEKGSIHITKEGIYRQQAFPVNAVDTVGTGDCFCGVFASSLSFGRSVENSLRRASAAAALSATVRGAQTSMPNSEQVDTFLFENRDIQ